MHHEAKIRRHNQTFNDFRPVVFCVRCGSTRVDQNSLTQLRCYDCDNTTAWNGLLFSIRRDKSTSDVTRAFDNADRATARGRAN